MSDPNKTLQAHLGTLGGLTSEQVAQLVAQLPQPSTSPDTTPTQAAWLLGIQFALHKLRAYVRS